MSNSFDDPGATTAQRHGGSGRSVSFDRSRLFAFIASGAIWIGGVSVGLSTGPVLASMAAAYVLPASLVLAVARERTAIMLAALWGCAVALMSVLAVPVAGAASIFPGLLFGSLTFGVWIGTGFLFLHFWSSQRRPARA